MASGHLRFVVEVLAISSAAILGVLLRVNVNRLFGPTAASVTSPKSHLFYDLPANVLGCLIMGLLNGFKSKRKVNALLSLAVSTGFAGSVTSTSMSIHTNIVSQVYETSTFFTC